MVAELFKGKYVIVRSGDAGVFAGILEHFDVQNRCVVIKDSRRLWAWAGAFTLSAVAQKGVSKPDECKFAIKVPIQVVAEVIELLPCTIKAQQSIKRVPEWVA